ncbi:MAG: hypothetical protein LBG59_03565 [Candidatus Peribacteria bacterium]|jgi:hypothetical protein|nr:hypothetical protein [Candidatus Peribacteria bacterium]
MKTSSEQSNTAQKKHKSRKQLGASLALAGALTFGASNTNAQTTPIDTTTISQLEVKQKPKSTNDAFLSLSQGVGTGTNK